MVDFSAYIAANPQVCHGQLCFSGTRIMVYQVLQALAEGASTEEVLTAYPTLGVDHIHAAMAYAAHVAKEDRFIPLAG